MDVPGIRHVVVLLDVLAPRGAEGGVLRLKMTTHVVLSAESALTVAIRASVRSFTTVNTLHMGVKVVLTCPHYNEAISSMKNTSRPFTYCYHKWGMGLSW